VQRRFLAIGDYQRFVHQWLKELARASPRAQSLGLCFDPLLKCLKRFMVLLPGAAVRIAEDLRTRAGLSLSYDAAGRDEPGTEVLRPLDCTQSRLVFKPAFLRHRQRAGILLLRYRLRPLV
jgi:hypothetical protein